MEVILMDKIILIRYGELSTKKSNINLFLMKLKENIDYALDDIEHDIIFDKGRMFINTSNIDIAVKRLKNVFGIQAIVIAYKLDKDFDILKTNIVELLKEKEFKTFKVTTKRSDKSYPLNSMEFSKQMGGYILKNIDNIKVDVNKPDIYVNVEIRKDYGYVYLDEIKGLGGYPRGVSGKGMLMLSGGIDSPVAGYLAIKRGVKLEAVYFAAPPHTSLDAQKKVEKLASKLSLYNNGIKLHIINFTEIEEAIYRYCPRDYLITIMRRMMYRISERLSYKNKAKCIVNGESIGQVASQTLTSMSVINEVTKMPIIRPLACFDKLEIIDLANKIDTYETSILPYEDCCTIFVPDHPVINPELNKAKEYEQLIAFEDMINKCIREEQIIHIKPNKDIEEFKDLL